MYAFTYTVFSCGTQWRKRNINGKELRIIYYRVIYKYLDGANVECLRLLWRVSRGLLLRCTAVVLLGCCCSTTDPSLPSQLSLHSDIERPSNAMLTLRLFISISVFLTYIVIEQLQQLNRVYAFNSVLPTHRNGKERLLVFQSTPSKRIIMVTYNCCM